MQWRQWAVQERVHLFVPRTYPKGQICNRQFSKDLIHIAKKSTSFCMCLSAYLRNLWKASSTSCTGSQAGSLRKRFSTSVFRSRQVGGSPWGSCKKIIEIQNACICIHKLVHYYSSAFNWLTVLRGGRGLFLGSGCVMSSNLPEQPISSRDRGNSSGPNGGKSTHRIKQQFISTTATTGKYKENDLE